MVTDLIISILVWPVLIALITRGSGRKGVTHG